MSYAVLADLPLGVYRGAGPDGGLDGFPTPARLHAALLCAAAQGPRAVADGDLLAPCPADAAALAWLEEHPPDGVLLPPRRDLRVSTVAYRREGTLVREGRDAGPKDKVFGKPAVGLVAVAGTLGWTWHQPPPGPVADSLAALVADVSHVGTSETPARLRIGTATPTHRRDPQAELFTGSGLDVGVATAGRTAALQAAYRAQQAAPTAAADQYSSSERALPPLPVAAGREAARYQPVQAPPPPAVWPVVQLARMEGRPPRPRERVAWAVAAHRALIARLGTAPPLLTGVYEPGASRPANRIALQFLSGGPAAAVGLDPDRAALLLLLPAGADPVEAALVTDAFARLDRLTVAGRSRRVHPLPPRAAGTFWPASPDDRPRDWQTTPAMVPDTRPPRRGGWSLADAALLSLGLVLRDRLDVPPGRGSDWYRQVRAAVAATGAQVHAATRLTEGNLADYVHRLPTRVVVQPLRVQLSTGALVGDRAVLAVGQSRHLGGGLLVPADLIEGSR